MVLRTPYGPAAARWKKNRQGDPDSVFKYTGRVTRIGPKQSIYDRSHSIICPTQTTTPLQHHPWADIAIHGPMLIVTPLVLVLGALPLMAFLVQRYSRHELVHRGCCTRAHEQYHICVVVAGYVIGVVSSAEWQGHIGAYHCRYVTLDEPCNAAALFISLCGATTLQRRSPLR